MLATEWSITPDGRTWNFKLRQGVSEYIFLGPNNGNYVYLEYVKGVRE